MTYYTPIIFEPDEEDEPGVFKGVIGLQLKQSDYEELLPSTVLEEPYELSFIAVFENNTSNLIWYKTVPSAIDS